MHDRLHSDDAPASAPPERTPPARRIIIPPSPFGAAFAFFGIALPLLTLGFELLTRACAQELFDPLPTWWHVALVAMVPVCNWLIWRALAQPDRNPHRGLHFAAGASLAVSAIYSVVFLPMAPFAAVGVLACGIGLLPLSPLFALFATVKSLNKFTRAFGMGRSVLGFGAGLAALGLPYLWDSATDSILQKATVSSGSEQTKHIQRLRQVGREQRILERCYFAGRNPLGSFFNVGTMQVADTETAREIYYRVTGKSFNEMPAPSGARLGARGRGMFNWDAALGSDRVAGKVAGLTLDHSSIETITQAADLTSYSEWTFVFRNVAANASEARAQIALPPGGVVSRLTLWIDGKPCEAAFGERSHVRAAYQSVAVVQRRDPVLVTTCGIDRVLMQCFPVPAYGGTMKVRVGITAPIQISDSANGLVALPRMIETNFEEVSGLKTMLSIPREGGAASERSIAMKELREGVTLPVTLPASHGVRVTEDPLDSQFSIVQSLESKESKPPGSLIYVVDGSGALRRHASEIAAHLKEVKPVAVYFAGDEVSAWDGTSAFEEWWRARSFAGGSDNLLALRAAWEQANKANGSAIVWIHGPQPVALADIEPFRVLIEQHPKGPAIIDVSVGGGPNRISAALENARWQRAPFATSLETRLQFLRESWRPGQKTWHIHRFRVSKDAVPANSSPGTRHIARLWAKDEVDRLRQQAGTNPDAAKLAARMQLVTPVSGAVVLETKAQYDQHGLKPVEAETAPSIPEPASTLLLASSATLLVLARRRRRTA